MSTPTADAAVALVAAEAAVEVLRTYYGRRLEHHDKSPTDFATDADLDAEDAIRSAILQALPDDGFVGEERGASGTSTERRWLVDPLCGTLNFAAGTPLAVVNIALSTPSGVTAAVCADPVAGELFWTDGRGGWLRNADDDVPLRPTARSKLVDIDCDGTGEFVGPQLVGDQDLRARYGPRVTSSTIALAWTAAGRRAAYITDGDLRDSVHFAAGIAVCRAAGCVVTDFDGGPVHTGPGLIAAADADIHDRLQRIVAKYR